STLAGLQQRQISHLFVAPKGHLDQVKQLTFGETALTGVRAASGGKLLALTSTGELSQMNQDGSQRSVLTPANNVLAVSPCGDRYYVFIVVTGTDVELWRMDTDGGNPVKLASPARLASCSPDGSQVLFSGRVAKHFRVPVTGGTPVEVADIPFVAQSATYSPDGKWIAYPYQEGSPIPITKFAVIPASGGPPVRVFTYPSNSGGLLWARDSKAIDIIETRNGVSNLLEWPLDGSASRKITNFTDSRIFDASWSLDGTQLFLARGQNTSDVVLFTNFR